MRKKKPQTFNLRLLSMAKKILQITVQRPGWNTDPYENHMKNSLTLSYL